MEEVIIEIPKRKIKLRAKNISEAIIKLTKLKTHKSLDSKKIADEYAGLFKDSSYRQDEEDWYKQ